MNATVDISCDCKGYWIPAQNECEEWLGSGLFGVSENRQCSISVKFVENSTSQSLNDTYRSKNSATSVLSFPADFPQSLKQQLDSFPLGDIVICPDIVEQEAAQQDKKLAAHWAHLMIHGLFHLLGYQHSSAGDAEIMENLEIKALERLGFPNPYLIG